MCSMFICTYEQRRIGHGDPSRTSFEYCYHGEHPNQQSKFYWFPVLAVIYMAINGGEATSN